MQNLILFLRNEYLFFKCHQTNHPTIMVQIKIDQSQMLRKGGDWQKIIRPVLNEKCLQFVQLCPNFFFNS